MSISITVIIPVFRDSDALVRTLASTDFTDAEVVVSATRDGDSLAAVRAVYPGVVWVESERGRARQMNAGAARARGQWLLFLHADTQLPRGWRTAVDLADGDTRVSAGCFRFALDSPSAIARVIELGVRVRVRLFGLPYGDQALFVRRAMFEALGGYRDLPIMEDVDLVTRLRGRGRLFRAPPAALTSARRWERDGWIRRTARHLGLILLYFAGACPDRLIRMAHPHGWARKSL